MELEHRRVVSTQLGIERRSSEHLGPVPRQPLDVLRVTGMRERVVEHGVVETAPVMSRGQRQECVLAAGVLEDRWQGHCSRILADSGREPSWEDSPPRSGGRYPVGVITRAGAS